MKNLTNILSYLWLLLLMAVTACSDLEEEVGPMQGEEEVELNIQLHVPDMQASTRTAPTENITAITAYAFDGNSQLIKVVKAILSDNKQATSGNLRIKVPKRTGDIHFIAKNNAESPDDVTISIGDNVSTLLSQTTDDLYYWGKATYNGGNELSEVTLTRNMAKLTLKKGEGFTANSCYIAGFVNRNLSGTIVPSGYQVGDTPTIPNNVQTGTYQADNSLGNVYYLFEHANVENNNPLYVIIEVAAKYYKVAFAAGDEYFPIIRNHEYTITIDGIDAMYAENNYTDAVNSQYPINDLVITSVPMTVTPDPAEVQNESGQTFTVTVTIPEGITELNVPTHDAFDITPPSSLTPQNGKYTVTQVSYEFTFTVKDGVEAGNKTISFSGRGKYKSATGSTTVMLTPPVVVQDQDMYEIWVNNNAWIGNNDADVAFFGYAGQNFNTGTSNSLESTFYDASADSHKSQAMVMGSDDSFTFTITGTEPRYLTLLVASNGNAPSIDLQKDGQAWTAPSNETKVPDNYNFANGDITNKGRLIRYELPAGTYTLQRGNNDYLLYYMRVSKDRPTMTDTELVQVQADSYVLSWSDDNTKDRFYKENDNDPKYFVDEEAKTFTAKLNYQEWENVNLTTTNLDISTVTWTFDNGNEESPGTKNTPEEKHSYDGNETVSIGNHNAGTYTLSGTVAPNSSYKYAKFYDRLPLSPVNFEVKNTIKVGLYDSWDGDAAPVSTYTDGKPLIIGFKMPQHTLPIEPGQQIQFTIPDVWVRDASGSGITYEDTNNGTRTYRIGNENNRYHPRTEWTYKIEWRDVAAESITATTTTDDIYFSYNGEIGKSVTIATSITNDNLDVALDFYADLDNNSQIDDSENRSDNRYEDLQLGTTRFYLKATISYEDSEKYNNETVQLQGEFPQLSNDVESGWAIHWDYSKESGNNDNNISYVGYNGLGLKFTVREGVTDYLIEWVFETGGSYGGGEIGFTYNISKPNGQNYLLTGDISVIIAFTNENNYTPSTPSENGVIFNCNFNDGSIGDVYKNSSKGEVYVEDQALVLKNESDLTNAWDAQARIYSNKFKNGQKYTLTFKAKAGNNTQNNKLQFGLQNDNGGNGNYIYLEYFNGYTTLTQEWKEFSHTFTTDIVATYFNLNFGELKGTIYIDDLKLVEVNN